MSTESDYQYNLCGMREALAEQAQKYPLLPGLVYTSLYDFVLQHGREYRPQPWRFDYEQGARAQCYGNALILAAQLNLKYVEGVALTPLGQVVTHGWNATDAGELVDSTWLNTGLVYLGVEFSVERGDDATWNGDGHVLNAEAQGYPVFRKRWEGEDYAMEWPHSDRIESHREWYRTGVYRAPPSVTAWLSEHWPQADISRSPFRWRGDSSHRGQK